MDYRSAFLRRLHERGYIHQCTDEAGLDALCLEGETKGKPVTASSVTSPTPASPTAAPVTASTSAPVTAYVGFDCTAPSLHIGNLLSIMMLRWFQQSGHRPIVLLGGGTTRIGDPSGKEESRKLLSEEAIEANIRRIRSCFGRFLDFGESASGALMMNNRDWLDSLNYIDFLREYGRHFSVNRMLGFDSVRLRLEREQPLSFLEFNYMVFQAFDFLELARREGCALQMGGSDQWGNIVNGVELARRVEGRSLYGVTSPLITTSGGEKMGKTAAGALWLDAEMTPPWEYWQYWRNVEDADVGRFLRLYTEVSLDEIARLEALRGAESNAAKIVLADRATALLHGEAVLAEIHAGVAARFHGENGFASGEDYASGEQGVPSVEVAVPAEGLGVLAALVAVGLAASNSEARRSVREGAVRVNGEGVSDEKLRLGKDDARGGKIRLSVGKKRHRVLVVSGG